MPRGISVRLSKTATAGPSKAHKNTLGRSESSSPLVRRKIIKPGVIETFCAIADKAKSSKKGKNKGKEIVTEGTTTAAEGTAVIAGDEDNQQPPGVVPVAPAPNAAPIVPAVPPPIVPAPPANMATDGIPAWMNIIPDFKGDPNDSGSLVHEFIDKIDKGGFPYVWTDETKIRVADYKLKGRASQLAKASKDLNEAKAAVDWGKYKAAMFTIFTPCRLSADMMRRIYDSQQRDNENARSFLGRVTSRGADLLRNEKRTKEFTDDQYAEEKKRLEPIIREAFMTGLRNKQHVCLLKFQGADESMEKLVTKLEELEGMERRTRDEDTDFKKEAVASYHVGAQPIGIAPARGKVNIKELKEDTHHGQQQYYPQSQGPRYPQQNREPQGYNDQHQQYQGQDQASGTSRQEPYYNQKYQSNSYAPQQGSYQQPPAYFPQNSSAGEGGGPPIFCVYCGKHGHFMVNCFRRQKDQGGQSQQGGRSNQGYQGRNNWNQRPNNNHSQSQNTHQQPRQNQGQNQGNKQQGPQSGQQTTENQKSPVQKFVQNQGQRQNAPTQENQQHNGGNSLNY